MGLTLMGVGSLIVLMDETSHLTSGYSPQVDIWMECVGHGVIALRQTAPTFVIAFEPRNVPACDAVIVVTVDGQRFERPVRLTGMTPTTPEAMILSRDSISPF